MDIFINGKQGAGKTRAAEAIVAELEMVQRHKAHLYAYYPMAITTVALLKEELRAARTRTVVFDGCILNGAQLLIAVQAVKEFREQVNADVLAIYVQQAEAINVKDVAESKLMQYSVDLGRDDVTAATLVQGDVTLVEARNIYAFEGALRLGKGTREPVSMLFELDYIAPISQLHVAVDKMNTHYFETGKFEKRAFNAKNVRRATAEETLRYLNAKLKYNAKNS